MNQIVCEDIVKRALQEDLGFKDVTSEAIFPRDQVSTAEILVKEQGILAGLPVMELTFRLLDRDVEFTPIIMEGSEVKPGVIVARVKGRTRALLAAERTALNFVQRLSGIATATRSAVDLVRGFNCKIVDTRKTTPGLRALEKYAVRAGGGYNHRFGLFDAVLIKDNHISAAGGISQAVTLVRETLGHMTKLEVETESLAQVEEAVNCGVDVIMLDNMSPTLMAAAVGLIQGRCTTEASGGITLDNLVQVAASGVDVISLGWLTHSAPSLDLSLNFTR